MTVPGNRPGGAVTDKLETALALMDDTDEPVRTGAF
jgi:hypothetical protein